MMDKYSLKLYKLIDSFDSIESIESIELNPFIKNVNESIKKILFEQPNMFNRLPTPIVLEKLHDKKTYPLIYEYFCILNTKNIKIVPVNDFLSFVEWFSMNQHLIDYDEIFKLILNASDDNLINLHTTIFENTPSRKSLHELIYFNTFVSLDIQQHAETCKLFKIKITNKLYDLDLYYGEDITDPLKELNNICEIILILREIASIYIKNYDKNKPFITIFLGRQKKYISKKNTSLNAENINSGSTYPHISVGVWRFEEYKKVLIHELIHFYGIDFHCEMKNYKFVKDIIGKYIEIEGTDSCNESYTETLAVLINSCLHSQTYKLNLTDVIHNEIKFSLFQVAKIISHFGGKSLDDLKSKKITIKQNTSVSSYFIVKLCLLYNIEEFLQFVCKTNLKCDNVKKFAELIDTSCNKLFVKDKKFNILKHYIHYISLNKKKSYVFKTMRMTING